MLNETFWRGLDLSQPGDLLAPGYMTKADEIILAGGFIKPRPAQQNQLSSPLAGAAYALTPFRSGSDSYLLLSSNNKLYKWLNGAVSVTEILDGVSSVTNVSTTAFMTSLAGFAYLVDGTNSLRRVSLASSSVATGLTPPAAPGAGRTNRTIGAASATWLQQAAIATTGLIPAADANFPSATTFWALSGGSSFGWTMPANGDEAVLLDTLDEGVHSDPMVNPAGSRVFRFECEIAARNGSVGNENECIDVICKAYSDTGGTTLITGGTITLRSEFCSSSPSKKVRLVFDFRGLATAVQSLKISIHQPFDRPDDPSTGQGTFVNRAKFYPTSQNFVFGGSVNVGQGGVAVGENNLLARDLYAITTLGAPVDLRGRNRLAIDLKAGVGVLSISARLVFYQGNVLGSGGVKYVSTALDWNVETGIATAEIGSVAASLSSVYQWGIEFTQDLTVLGILPDGTLNVLQIGSLYESGNLLSESGIYYRVVGVDVTTDPTNLLNVLQSDGSDPSPVVETTAAQSMVNVSLPTISAPATYFKLFRFGGGLPDGEGRLVVYLLRAASTFAYGADANKGTAPFYAQSANPYISWDGTNILDNTPDEWLIESERYVSGRELPPSAPVDVCAWRQRLWLLKGSEIYASWSVDSDTQGGLYWTRLGSATSDAEGRYKGWFNQAGLEAGDSLQRAIPLRSALVLLTKWSIYVVTGADPGSFECRQVQLTDQVGLYARRAVCVVDDLAFFLSEDGLYTFNGAKLERVSDTIRGTSEDAGLVANSAACMTYAAEKLFLSSNGETWVYHLPQDARWRGWVRWAVNMVDATRLAGVLVCSISTQLCKFSGNGSVATAIKTRTTSKGDRNLLPGRVRANLLMAGAHTATIGVGQPGSLITGTWNLISGENRVRYPAPRNARGARMQVSLAVTATGDFTLRGLDLELSEGGVER